MGRYPPPAQRFGDLDAYVVHVPLRLRFRRVDARDAVLLRGPVGWGEFSPFPEYGADYAARWLTAAREAATRPWPAPRRSRIAVNTTVPAVDPSTAARLVAGSGCTTAKVKVAEPGQSLAEDRERVAAVRDVLGVHGRLRIDANGAWDVATAALAIARLDRYDLEYVEQPVATLEEMRALRAQVGVPIAADESVRTAHDPARIAGLDAADVLVLKAQPLGGVARALEVAAAAGLPVVVSSALETSVGLAAGVAFAAALEELPFACGLGTASLLAGDVVAEPLAPVAGHVPVLRPEPSAALLRRWAPPPGDAQGLLARLTAAADAPGSYR